MWRKLHIQYPGAMHQVMNRGDQRKDIFRDDQDRQKFPSTLDKGCAKTEWQVGRELDRLDWAENQLPARLKGHRSMIILSRPASPEDDHELGVGLRTLADGHLNLCF